MNTRRALVLILIAGLLGLHTVYTRTASLDYSLRTGQLYTNGDRLKEQKRELEVNLAIMRQPVAAIEKASKYCPDLEPAHPELAAFHIAKDRPQLAVPSLKDNPPAPVPVVAPAASPAPAHGATPATTAPNGAASTASAANTGRTVPAAGEQVNDVQAVDAARRHNNDSAAKVDEGISEGDDSAVDMADDPSEATVAPAQGMLITPSADEDRLATATKNVLPAPVAPVISANRLLTAVADASHGPAPLVPMSAPHHVH